MKSAWFSNCKTNLSTNTYVYHLKTEEQLNSRIGKCRDLDSRGLYVIADFSLCVTSIPIECHGRLRRKDSSTMPSRRPDLSGSLSPLLRRQVTFFGEHLHGLDSISYRTRWQWRLTWMLYRVEENKCTLHYERGRNIVRYVKRIQGQCKKLYRFTQ